MTQVVLLVTWGHLWLLSGQSSTSAGPVVVAYGLFLQCQQQSLLFDHH